MRAKDSPRLAQLSNCPSDAVKWKKPPTPARASRVELRDIGTSIHAISLSPGCSSVTLCYSTPVFVSLPNLETGSMVEAQAVLRLQAAAVMSATKPLIKAFCSGVRRSRSCAQSWLKFAQKHRISQTFLHASLSPSSDQSKAGT